MGNKSNEILDDLNILQQVIYYNYRRLFFIINENSYL